MQSKLVRGLLALSIGALGGWAAHAAKLPLAWMIGAMLATTTAAVAEAQVALPIQVRNIFVSVLGVMLGSGFRPEMLDKLGEWSISLGSLLFYCAASGLVGFVYFRRFCGYDRPTSYFAAMPGGLSEMILVGSSLGGDPRVISLSHASRVLIVVLVLPFGFQILLGYDPANRPPVGAPLFDLGWQDWAMLGGCALVGALTARSLKVPAAMIVGPMLLSAAIHLAGWTKATPPAELVAAAQVVVGTAIGCRFAGTSVAFVLRAVRLAGGATVLMLSVTVGSAVAVHAITGLPAPYLVLAYSPGGLAEMSLVALALSFDAAFVATHHIVRIILVVVLAPQIYRLTEKHLAVKPLKGQTEPGGGDG